MATNLNIQELAIALAAKNLNPIVITADFLKGSGIVSSDWELARPPVLSAQVTQTVYKSGLSVVARPGVITLAQSLGNEAIESLALPQVAAKLVSTLAKIDYQAVDINLRRFVTFANQSEGGRQFINETLLASGSWQVLGDTPLQASLNLAYTIDGQLLRLTIAEAKLRMAEQEQEPTSAVLFAGNFHYDITEAADEQRLQQVHSAIARWQEHWQTYQEIIDDKFLAPSQFDAVIPVRDAV